MVKKKDDTPQARIYITKERWIVLEVWDTEGNNWSMCYASKIFNCEETVGSRTIDYDMLPMDFMNEVLRLMIWKCSIKYVPLEYIENPYIPDDIEAKLVLVKKGE